MKPRLMRICLFAVDGPMLYVEEGEGSFMNTTSLLSKYSLVSKSNNFHAFFPYGYPTKMHFPLLGANLSLPCN